jgi:GntR family transcriptional regulator
LSDTFVTKIKNCLRRAGINHLDFDATISKDEKRLEQIMIGAEAVIVSQNRRKEIEALSGGELEVIEFRFLPDLGSVNIIKTTLLELTEK